MALLWGTTERNTAARTDDRREILALPSIGPMIEGSPRTFPNMLNCLFPAELQAAIREQNGLIGQIAPSLLDLQISSGWLYRPLEHGEIRSNRPWNTACIGVQIRGIWPEFDIDHTLLPSVLRLSILIDVYFAGHVEIRFVEM